MKCTKCGKNEAVCHYFSDVNGKRSENHLCADCAREEERLGNLKEFETGSLLGNIFSDDIFSGFGFPSFFETNQRRSLLDRMFSDDFFSFPSLIPVPSALSGYTSQTQNEDDTKENDNGGTEQNASVNAQVDSAISKKREIFKLREEMHKAARAENYEEAAKLRDKLHALENEKRQ